MKTEYAVEIFDRATSGFGPGAKLGELWDARNLGWGRYSRLPGKAFWTLYQKSVAHRYLEPQFSHIRITRITPTVDTEVFNGLYEDYNSTGDDVVCSAFDYLAYLSLSRSGFRTMYPSKLLGTEIVSPEWISARTATNALLGFVTTGTIENPLAQDGVTEIKTNTQFGTVDQQRLQLIYDLSEMGRANTLYNVSYHISRTAPFTFSFLKNAGTDKDVAFVLNGTVRDYQHWPRWISYRNDLATIGTTVSGGAAEVVSSNAAEGTLRGLRQDVASIRTLVGVSGAATEQDQQKSVLERLLNMAIHQRPYLSVELAAGTIHPFVGWDIEDTGIVEIANGADYFAERRRITGVRGLVSDGAERVYVALEPVQTV